MKEILFLGMSSVLLFCGFLTILIIGLVKNKTNYIITSGIIFLVFMGIAIYTGFQFGKKSSSFLKNTFKNAHADYKQQKSKEIYIHLFGEPLPNCLKILEYDEDMQINTDDTYWLNFETCPAELKRILAQREYNKIPLGSTSLDTTFFSRDAVPWFQPETLGDSVMRFDYAEKQTLWVSADSSKVFCKSVEK